MFKITMQHGFHITFENGWTISVQFGPGNYCDNYDMEIGREDQLAGKQGSTTAECAAWGSDGNLVDLPSNDGQVTNRSTPAEVLALMQWVATNAP